MEDKKKPGRPKKQQATTQHVVFGIVTTPEETDNVVELHYCNPMLFKKILTLLKSFSASYVELVFDTDTMKINAIDHLEKSSVFITVDCKYVNRYYCKEKVIVNIKLSDLEKATHTLNNNHNKIMFTLKDSFRTVIYCGFTESTYDVEETYEITVINNQEKNYTVTYDDAGYPLKFKLGSKHFKDKIAAIGSMSENFSIQKIGTDNLEFLFTKPNGISMRSVYKDSAAIRLTSTLVENDILNVNVIINYIYPFSNANIGREVFIAVDKIKPLSMLTYVDQQSNGEHVAKIHIFVEK